MNHELNSSKVWRLSSLSIRWKPYPILMGLTLLLLLCSIAVIALNTGRNSFGLERVFATLFNSQVSGFANTIIWDVRLPRVITAIFVGVALGVSGAIFQSISRNPLGSPDIIGFTSGSASGAIFYLIFIGETSFGIAISAIVGGVLTAIMVYFLSFKRGSISRYRLILIGIGVGSTLTALNGLMLVKGNLNSAMVANIWLTGSLNARQWENILPLVVGVFILIPLIYVSSYKLTLIEMGDELAQQLGVNVQRTRLILTFYAVLLASLATAAAGPIAFIALAAPQLASRIIRSQGVPIIGSSLMGAILLLVSDLLSQTLPFDMTLPIGLITAFVGGLYLLWIVTRVVK